MLDESGYRKNIGIIIFNQENKLLLAKRIGQNAWQFPQGGIDPGETLEDALARELHEEIGLNLTDLKIVARTKTWLEYAIPKRFQRTSLPVCLGQKQIWFLLKSVNIDEQIRLDESADPEFDDWRWVNYWQALQEIIYFKRDVYQKVLLEFSHYLKV